MSIVNDFMLEQIRMPMVKDMRGGDDIIAFFQNCLGALILTFIKAGLITDDFHQAYAHVLDEESGMRKDVSLDNMGVSDMLYDLRRMINRYMVVLGHEDEIIPEKDDLYGNTGYFTPHRYE